MYRLIRSRYEGFNNEIIQEIVQGTYKQMKDIQNMEFNGGSYVDQNGDTWQTEILRIHDEKELKTEKIEIRVDYSTKKEIKEKADRLGLSISAYLVMLSKKDGNEIAKD